MKVKLVIFWFFVFYSISGMHLLNISFTNLENTEIFNFLGRNLSLLLLSLLSLAPGHTVILSHCHTVTFIGWTSLETEKFHGTWRRLIYESHSLHRLQFYALDYSEVSHIYSKYTGESWSSPNVFSFSMFSLWPAVLLMFL